MHGEELHLDEHVKLQPSIKSGRAERAQSTRPALLGAMSSDWAETLTRALEAEPYSSDQVRTGALQAVFYSENRVPRALAACPGRRVSRRGHETHAHGY